MSVIRSLSVGDGDMFYIKHNSDNFTMIDCCMDENTQKDIVAMLQQEATGKNIVRFISTHPDDDHLAGLTFLDDKMKLLNFYCVKNETTKPEETDDFNRYCELKDHPNKAFHIFRGCQRQWMNQESPERGSSGIEILWPIVDNKAFKDALKLAQEGKSPNNISAIIHYTVSGGVSVLWMGDLESSFMEQVLDEITLPQAHVLFAPHHGRDSGKVPAKWLKQINPSVVVIGEAPSKDLNYYPGYNTITQNSAGDITLNCTAGAVDFFVSERSYAVDFLVDNDAPNTLGYYIGTLAL